MEFPQNAKEIIISTPKTRPKVELTDFVYVKLIGRGSFGKVMLVEQENNKSLFAMKIIRKKLLKERKQESYALEEKNIL